MLLRAELLCREFNVRSICMGMDNQAAIMVTVSRSCHSGHVLTDLFLQTLESALRKHNLRTLVNKLMPVVTRIHTIQVSATYIMSL